MLPDRYPTPLSDSAFHPNTKIANWMTFAQAYMKASIMVDATPDQTEDLLSKLFGMTTPSAEAVATRELTTGHDVVAFLSLLEDQIPQELKRHLHYGLTSSDLVDNAHFHALRAHAEGMSVLVDTLARMTEQWDGGRSYPRAGRTHGQIADITTWNHQLKVHRSVLRRLFDSLHDYAVHPIIKSGGPTGNSKLVEYQTARVALAIRGVVVPSTQVIPRDYQLEWAALYLRLGSALENLALQIRLGARAEVGEVREGAERVGSSAMPHKRNPIDSEKVCGLARVARGHFVAISEGLALWEDRDLTNSSLERVAVPGLAATVEYMLRTMIKVIKHLRVDGVAMRRSAYSPQTMTNAMQTLAQKHFKMGPVEAGEWVRSRVTIGEPRNWAGNALREAVGEFGDVGQRWFDDVENYHTRMLG